MAAIPPSSWSNPIHILAFGFGSGAAPVAPGTFGTLAAVAIYYFFLQSLSLPVYVLVLVASSLVGVYLCGRTAADLGVHDHSSIVWDEFAGFWLTMLAVPHGLGWLLAGFVLFRFFDIVKPWPIGWIDQHVHGGTGIMVDDLVAGLYALLILQVAAYFLRG